MDIKRSTRSVRNRDGATADSPGCTDRVSAAQPSPPDSGRPAAGPLAAAVLTLLCGAGIVRADEDTNAKRLADDSLFPTHVQATIETYCLDCHGEYEPEAGIAFHGLNEPAQILSDRDKWEAAWSMLRINGMPPKDYFDRPSERERAAIVDWLDLKLHHIDCELVNDPGRVTIQRLNRAEYNNTVRDLVGIDLQLANDFPTDDVGYGFNNVGDVLSLPPLLLEKYVDAAETIAAAAMETDLIGVQQPPSEGKQAARKIFQRLMPRAFRRPVETEEVDRIVELVMHVTKDGGSFEQGIQVGLQAVLVSPHFLFRVELDTEPDNPGDPRRINDFELASRLSYFLWSSMPDQRLFELAQKKVLHQPEILDAEVARMLDSPKAVALVDNFASQWLNLGSLFDVNPDPQRFPEFSSDLRDDMIQETKLFAGEIFRENLSLLAFLDADFSFLNERLAQHYGISGVSGDHFRRVSLPADQRAGVLTQASILTLTSNPNRTSLVQRGKWILDNVLGYHLPDPPPNVPTLEEGAEESGVATLREQLALHRASPTCASCHDTLDPLGFGFENFNAIGRWRTTDNGQPIDSAGSLPSGESFSGPIELLNILKRREQEFLQLVSRKMLTYALGRGLQLPDSCAVDAIVTELQQNQARFEVLVRAVVHSPPFLMRSGDSG